VLPVAEAFFFSPIAAHQNQYSAGCSRQASERAMSAEKGGREMSGGCLHSSTNVASWLSVSSGVVGPTYR
jgi:hypothetical protein